MVELRAAQTGSLPAASSWPPTGEDQGSEYASRLNASWAVVSTMAVVEMMSN